MIESNYDAANALQYEENTKAIDKAIDLIIKDKSKKLTVTELSRVSNKSKGMLRDRGFTREYLDKVMAKKLAAQAESNSPSDRELLIRSEEQNRKLKEELTFWFFKASSAYEIDADHKKSLKKKSKAIRQADEKNNELQEKIAHLIDERNRLQEIIRELT